MKVSLLMAQTLDGRIARDARHFPDWTESADKKFFAAQTRDAGVMIFGKNTFETLPGVLPGRLSVVQTRNAGEWDEASENLVMTSLAPAEILKKLAALGHDHVIVAGGATINTLWAGAGLLDEVILTVSPVVFGEGLGVFGEGVEMALELEKFEKIGETTVALWYAVKK